MDFEHTHANAMENRWAVDDSSAMDDAIIVNSHERTNFPHYYNLDVNFQEIA